MKQLIFFSILACFFSAEAKPRFTVRYEIIAGRRSHLVYQDKQLLIESQEHMNVALRELDRAGRLDQLIYVRRIGSEIIEGQLGRISGIDFFFKDGRLPPLIGVNRPFRVNDIPADAELNAEIKAAMTLVSNGFEQQIATRKVFTPELIESLKSKDRDLDSTRLQYVMITNSVLLDSDASSSFVGIVGLFDGQISSILQGSYDLPVERKFPDYDLVARPLYQDKVIEIRQLNLGANDLRLMTRIVGEHLLQIGKEDYFLYAHTDEAGMQIFTLYGFEKEKSFEDGTFLLGMPARAFIEKVVPESFVVKYYAQNCDEYLNQRIN